MVHNAYKIVFAIFTQSTSEIYVDVSWNDLGLAELELENIVRQIDIKIRLLIEIRVLKCATGHSSNLKTVDIIKVTVSSIWSLLRARNWISRKDAMHDSINT